MYVHINRKDLEVQGASNQGQLRQLHHEYPAQKNLGFKGHFLKISSADFVRWRGLEKDLNYNLQLGRAQMELHYVEEVAWDRTKINIINKYIAQSEKKQNVNGNK